MDIFYNDVLGKSISNFNTFPTIVIIDLTCFFSESSYIVMEGDIVNVSISTSTSDFSFPFRVTLSYMDGTANQNVDYTPSVVTVDFAPGQQTATFSVGTIDDIIVEKLENFKIMKIGVSEPGKVSPGTPDMVTVNIVDNDGNLI